MCDMYVFAASHTKYYYLFLVFIFLKLTCLTSWTSMAGSSRNCSRNFLKVADSFIRAALWYRESLCPVRTRGSVSPSRMAQIALIKQTNKTDTRVCSGTKTPTRPQNHRRHSLLPARVSSGAGAGSAPACPTIVLGCQDNKLTARAATAAPPQLPAE